MADNTMMRSRFQYVILLVTLSLAFTPIADCSEENELWLLLSSYEDIGITVQDLAFFLATHGFDATPEKSYVTVTFSSGDEAYLVPNGAAPRLAELWALPPDAPSGPVKIIQPDAIKKDITYSKTDNSDFLKEMSRRVMFPVTPLGMCYDGSQKLADTYGSFGYNTTYMYDPSQWDWQGHLWIVVEDDGTDRWVAVDSYYGVVRVDNLYYSAPYSFEDFKYLDSINPKWRI